MNEQLIATYISIAWRIGWGLCILFGIIGILVGHALGPLVILITTTVWISLRILLESAVALWSLRLLRQFNKDNDQDHQD